MLIGGTQHAIQFNPIVSPENIEKVHHILLYECDGMTEDEHAYEGPCWNSDTPRKLNQCNFGKIVTAWAIGGGPNIWPPEAGFPLGSGTGQASHYLMEIHYDNFDGLEFTDSSGIQMFYTPTLRDNDGGVLTTGSLVGIDIPPGEEEFDMNSRCPGE